MLFKVEHATAIRNTIYTKLLVLTASTTYRRDQLFIVLVAVVLLVDGY